MPPTKKDYGRQIQFYGENMMQTAAQCTAKNLPTLGIDLTTKSAEWDNKLSFQLDPVFELPELVKFLCQRPITTRMKEFSHNSPAKVLTLRYNTKNQDNTKFDGTMFVGIFDNKSSVKYHKVIGEKQMFVLRSMAMSQLAKLYECSIYDLIQLLSIDKSVCKQFISDTKSD
ncbi:MULTISPECIES: hypothetical protein [Vibrio]|uniref:Uncharacterized protein n=2 Tax=Vibrio TaxID=662 RepID=A0AAU9QSB1_9VIBR|nr:MULTISPECIES: hypothetical protein [Vibrio]MCZ2798846.1 hypothetical protein [Vibrio alginolyticus]POB46971.1 hypothetical protein CRN52_12905 [Vibrio vulnificus]CAH1590084.1 conserved hypothetical protein [Vibrio jasicida]CAH1599341.1 conserved hypothetical protein [Vibrio jasicida]